MITVTARQDKEKGDLKQAVTTNMYFAFSDQEKEAWCHIAIS